MKSVDKGTEILEISQFKWYVGTTFVWNTVATNSVFENNLQRSGVA